MSGAARDIDDRTDPTGVLDPAPARSRTDQEPADEPRSVALRMTILLWSVALVFALIAVARSAQMDIPFRDPGGLMFRGRLTKAVEGVVVLALVQAVVLAVRAGWTWRGPLEQLRRRWTLQRVGLVLSGLVAYHVVYASYRNLKSWDAFNTPRDQQLLDLERTLFFGHSPAVLLHDLLGQGDAATVLAVVYRSFTYLVPLSFVATLALLPRMRQAYVMLCSVVWTWILGTASYYLIPTLGPFASAPHEFAGLRQTPIVTSQTKYLAERAHLLADPSAHDAFASISAFASLHVGFTATVLLVVWYYRWRRTAFALACYLAAVMVSTIYFGWHFVVDDIAGLVLALTAFSLGRLIADPPRLRARRAEPA